MKKYFGWIFFVAIQAYASDSYKLDYQAAYDQSQKGFRVSIVIEQGNGLDRMTFSNAEGRYQQIRANGKLILAQDKVEWVLPRQEARMEYFVPIIQQKGEGKFDAYATEDWAIFRGDNLVPAFTTYEKQPVFARARLNFVLPKGWGAESAWEKKDNNSFVIDNPERQFDRPVGWFVIGNIGTRQTKVAGTSLVVASPKGSGMQRMEALTFFSFVWPEIKKTFGTVPDKLLIAGAPDPMWRGGLSASNSLYLHINRPLVSENGTSPLFHELTHMITRISGVETDKTNDDWIAEGLAEYYSFELLYKAGGISKARKTKILKKLAGWGKDVKHLRKSKSTGPVTARAVVLLAELDEEIRSQSKHDLADVTRILMKKRRVSLDDLKAAVETLIGKPSKTLQSPLLR